MKIDFIFKHLLDISCSVCNKEVLVFNLKRYDAEIKVPAMRISSKNFSAFFYIIS